MTSREGSAAPSSGGDTVDEQVDDSKLVPADADDTLSDLPPTGDTPTSVTKVSRRGRGGGGGVRKPRPKKGAHVWVHESLPDGTEDESTSSVKIKKSGSPDPDGKDKNAAVGTRRQANGTVGSVYSGSKIRHIKKADGIPLWRKDIQYKFLQEVVKNETACFTRLSDGKKECTFAEIYVDCLARSSKTSKILKDRLQIDKPAAENMAMICLLVNVGRMNTTLNFFPEMRAQLRTYHPIPALQAYPTQRDYKSLQDAPRLKSILKGASEDTEQPRNLKQLKTMAVPRTHPVNLIFVLSHFASDIAQAHFTNKVDFFDLVMRSTISSKSRARAFLWLMWWYLESSFDKESALNNPFGPGEYKDGQDSEDPNEIPLLVPQLDTISEEEGDAENVDPEQEIQFGEKMTKERERINAEFAQEDAAFASAGRDIEHKGVKRLKRSARDFGDDDSDADSLRASPGRSPASGADGGMGLMANQGTGSLQADSLEDDWEPVDAHPGRGRYKRIRGKNTSSRARLRSSEVGATGRGGRSRLGLSDRGTPDTNRGTPQPLPPGTSNHPVLSQFSGSRSRHDIEMLSAAAGSAGGGSGTVKSRARTGYQRELEEHRQRRIEWLLKKKRRVFFTKSRYQREQGSWILKAARRISDLPATYDSEDDDEASSGLRTNSASRSLGVGTGLGGIVGRKSTGGPANRARSDSSDSNSRKASDTAAAATANGEPEDYGEEANHWTTIFKRTSRRLETWSGEKDLEEYLRRQRKLTAGIARGVRGGNRDSLTVPVGRRRRGGAASGRSLDDEITQDLLAERSADDTEDEDADDDDDDDDVDGATEDDEDGDGDGDGDITMADDGADPSDVEMD